MKLVGSREESIPPSTWTESGRTTILKKSSSSRDKGAYFLSDTALFRGCSEGP